MMESLFGGFFLRLAQAAIEASPTFLSGLLIAGILQRMVGPEHTRRLFGGPGWKGIMRAWVLGMLLPVCSLGVLPVARVMRRSGVPGANVLAFMLIGPLLNPISFLYGLTLGEPKVICCYVGLSLFLALSAGLLWQRLFPDAAAGDPELIRAAEAEPLPAPGAGRLFAVALTAARELIGPAAIYVLVAVTGTAMLSAALPRGCLQTTMQPTDPFSPLLMAAVTGPAYMGPLPGMMRVGSMFEHGNSVGAAFVLFVLGIGVNIGVVAWVGRSFGWKPALTWFGVVTLATLVLAYAVDKPLRPIGMEAVEHTHAFDDFASPYFLGQHVAFDSVLAKIVEKVGILEGAALIGLAVLLLLALAERASGLAPRLESFLTRRPADGPARPRARWDINIPGPVLGAIALIGLVVFSVVGAYVYYPPRKQVFTEMAAVRADAYVALRNERNDEAIRRLEQWDLLTRKLQVGELLWTLRYDEEAAKKADDLREAMEKVRDALLAGETQEAKLLFKDVDKSYQACREAHRE